MLTFLSIPYLTLQTYVSLYLRLFWLMLQVYLPAVVFHPLEKKAGAALLQAYVGLVVSAVTLAVLGNHIKQAECKNVQQQCEATWVARG